MSHSTRSPRSGPAVTEYCQPYSEQYSNSAYYREGLRRYVTPRGGTYREISMGRAPDLLKAMRKVRTAYRLRPFFERAGWIQPAIDRLAARIEGGHEREVRPLPQDFDTSCRYAIATAGGREIRVSLDFSDDCARIDQQILDWGDVYFKTNYRPTDRYSAKIQPFVNADPTVLPRIQTMRRARSAAKVHDLCMVVRVWGGKDEVEGVEHNLRLIEAVARARCSKFLYAYLVAGDIAAATRRLERQGIPCGTAPIPPEKLWRVTAASRLNVIRLGMHYCVPWRVTGALAIGSGIVLDRDPLTRWPEPLTAGVHYVALGAETGVDRPLATDEQYAAIPEKIEAWLADGDLASRLGQNTGEYFDRFVAPERVGEHIVAAVARLAAGSPLTDPDARRPGAPETPARAP